MLKAAAKLTLLIALGTTAYTQEVLNPSISKRRNYLGFSLIPSFSEKAKIEGDKDTYDLKSHSRFGLEALIQYHINFAKNYSLVFGVGGNVFTTCFHYHIQKEMFDPPAESDISTGAGHQFGFAFAGPTSVKVQAELLRRWRHNNAHNWNVSAGFSLLYSLNGGGGQTWRVIEYPNGQTKQYVIFTENVNNYEKPWMNYHISGGHEWVLKSKDILQVNLKVNLSPADALTINYLFTTGVQPDLSGTFKSSGSYIGLSIAYIDTWVTFRVKNKGQK